MLICNDTRIRSIPNYDHLEFLLCFDTGITIIPKSTCNSINRCYSESKLIFVNEPLNIIELYSIEEDIHYLKKGENAGLNCKDEITKVEIL